MHDFKHKYVSLIQGLPSLVEVGPVFKGLFWF